MARIDYYEAYNNETVARARKVQLERQYDPRGYGTSLTVNHRMNALGGMSYVVEGHRYDSCD